MTSRCKFRCVDAAQSDPAKPEDGWRYRFEAVTSGNPENESFFRWTPSGQLTLSVVREHHYEVGKEYYLDISPA